MLNLFLSPHSVMNTETSLFGKNIPKFLLYFQCLCGKYNSLTLLTQLFPELKVNVLANKYDSLFPLLFWVPDDIQLIFIKFLFFRSV